MSGYQPLGFYQWPIFLSIATLSFYSIIGVTRYKGKGNLHASKFP
jgi:hypothetical protein